MNSMIEALKDGTFCPKQFRIFERGRGNKTYIREEYRTESCDSIRAPSHNWPWSEFKHAFTKKYQKQLLAKLEAQQTTGLVCNVGVSAQGVAHA